MTKCEIFVFLFFTENGSASSKQIIIKQQAFDIRGIQIAQDKRGYPHKIFLFHHKRKKHVFDNH